MFPKIFQIGDFFLPAYGVLVALGVLAGLKTSTTLARRKGVDPEKISNLVVLCALACCCGCAIRRKRQPQYSVSGIQQPIYAPIAPGR